MTTTPRKPEVLAPAGGREQLFAALATGADAIYFGLQEGFNARARASNFAIAELPEIMSVIHRGNARGFVTFNTLVFESELATAAGLLIALDAAGVDAVIVQDPAVALLARALDLSLEVHGSTQMTVASPLAANLVKGLGLSRVVVPRELSVADIAAYAAGTDVELEVFIHGALCVSWSGQCLTSESWGGRSANRGQCAQSCRLPYELQVDGQARALGDVQYLLSPQDLAGIDVVPALAEIGVASLKIEGRQKDANYVATAVTAYRHAVDGAAAARDEDVAAMAMAYSRGFSPGFFAGANHQALVVGKVPRHRGVYLGTVRRIERELVLVDEQPASGETIPGRDNGLMPRISPIAGQGVVFDSHEGQAAETGGPIFDAFVAGPGQWALRFGKPGPELTRVKPGAEVWITSAPAVEKQSRADVARGQKPLGRLPVAVDVRGAAGAPLVARASVDGGATWVSASSTSALAAATGAGLATEVLRDKLGKFGGTDFHLGQFVAEVEAGLHVPVSEINAMRRELTTQLEAAMVDGPRRPAPAQTVEIALASLRAELAGAEPVATTPQLVVMCRNDAQLDAAIAAGATHVEIDWMEFVGMGAAVAKARAAGLAVGIATVRIQKPGDEKLDQRIAKLAPDWVLVRSWGSLAFFRDLPVSDRPVLHGDYSLNITNSLTAAWVLQAGLATYTPSHDLDVEQLTALLTATGGACATVTLHHHIPTFHTEHCVYAHLLSKGADYKTCGRPCEAHQVSLKDRTGLVHPVVVDVACRNTVFNAQAQSAPRVLETLRPLGLARVRVELVRETGEQAQTVIAAYQALLAGTINAQEVLRRVSAHEQFGVTRGTMNTMKMLNVLA
ncbi:MAG: U32 family peptidase [Myxococcales bacterium]|nr:U32 family peptidase [Myxococcales bacterium]